MALENESAVKAAFSAALKKGSIEYQESIKAGKHGKGDSSSDRIAKRINDTLPEGVPLLSGRRIRSHVTAGRAGLSPKKKGPQPTLPAELFVATSSYVQMMQLAGDEQRPRAIARVMKAAVLGTPFESSLKTPSQASHALKRLRRDHTELSSLGKCSVDDRRWLWLTYDNLDRWFDGWHTFLVEKGFGYERKQQMATREKMTASRRRGGSSE